MSHLTGVLVLCRMITRWIERRNGRCRCVADKVPVAGLWTRGGGGTLYSFGKPTGEGRPDTLGPLQRAGKRGKKKKKKKKETERKWEGWSLNLIAVNGCSVGKSDEETLSGQFDSIDYPHGLRRVIGRAVRRVRSFMALQSHIGQLA